jgi:hypothetical protein
MRRLTAAVPAMLAMVATLAATVQPAQALTIRDVIELSRAGLTDDVLVALIEVDAAVYPTDAATLKSLKDGGVSDRVMIALIRSGRERRVEEPVPAPVVEEAAAATPPPPTVVIEHREVIVHHEPQVQQVAIPVYVPVYPVRGHARRAEPFTGIQESTFVPLQPGIVRPRPEPQPAKPVYWGFGGKLRPDAWGQPQERDTKAPDAGTGTDRDSREGREGSRSSRK